MNLKSHTLHLKPFICLALLFVYVPSFSQEKKDTTKSAVVKHKILLIPFKSTMIMSEIGKAVNTSTHLSYPKITEAFRSSLDLALFNAFKQSYTVVSFLQEKKKADTTLAYTYSNIGYSYDIIPGSDTSGESHAEYDPALKKKYFMHNGKLEVPIDYTKRFMNVSIGNPHLLSFLSKKENADIFIFINELDIQNVANTPTEDLTASNFRREVTVQYSILNAQKQSIARGILITYFPSNVNDPKIIGEQYFSVIAKDMVKVLTTALQKPLPDNDKKATQTHTKTVSNKK